MERELACGATKLLLWSCLATFRAVPASLPPLLGPQINPKHPVCLPLTLPPSH